MLILGNQLITRELHSLILYSPWCGLTGCMPGKQKIGRKCRACPAGSYSSQGKKCKKCTGESFSKGGAAACTACTATGTTCYNPYANAAKTACGKHLKDFLLLISILLKCTACGAVL